MYLILNRGLMGYPKNSKDGVLLSKFDKTSDGVMIDVRMTKDNKLVLSENDLVIKNNYISKMNYDDLKKINIGNGIDNYYIPLLEEILKYYDKDILIIKLHHNYDENEKLVNELNKVLKKYYIKRLIIAVSNDNLFDYLKIYTKYEIYDLNNVDNFIYVDVINKNYNGVVNNYLKKSMEVNKSNNEKDIFVITNNTKILKSKLLNN